MTRFSFVRWRLCRHEGHDYIQETDSRLHSDGSSDVTMLMRQMLIFSITECVKINIDV